MARKVPTRRELMAVLRANRLEAVDLSSKAGVARVHRLLGRAQRDLNERLRTAESLRGPGKDSFTATQLRATLAQIRDVVGSVVRPAIRGTTLDVGKDAAEGMAEGTIDYLQMADRAFTGVARPLGIREGALYDRAVAGSRSSILHRLEPDPRAGPGILDRYGDAVVSRFEESLGQRLLAQQPWEQVRDNLIADSPFLQQAPGHWAERIVRTEVMGAAGRASWESIRSADADLGDMAKILCATFDNRTGADSYAVHGQIRRPEEAFQWWEGLYQHPPNRPNDREVVVPHRVSWPIPGELQPRSDGDVAACWAREKRKGGPPPRPKMTTIPLEKFGAPPPAKSA